MKYYQKSYIRCLNEYCVGEIISITTCTCMLSAKISKFDSLQDVCIQKLNRLRGRQNNNSIPSWISLVIKHFECQ